MIALYLSMLVFWHLVYKLFLKFDSNKSISLCLSSMTHWVLINGIKQGLMYYTSFICESKECYDYQIKEYFLMIWFIPSTYFTYDMIIKIYLKKLTQWYFIHHSLAIFLSLISYFTQSNIMENSLILYYSTFCNIPMNLKDILRMKKQQDTLTYHFVTVAFIMCYFYGIIIGMTYIKKSFTVETHFLVEVLLILLRFQAIYTIIFRLKQILIDSLIFIREKMFTSIHYKNLKTLIF